MPGTDGYGLVESIRRDSSFDDLVIMFLTSATHPGEQQRCLDLRVAAHLTKPVKQSELYNVMLRVLGGELPAQDGWLPIEERTVELPPMRVLLTEDSLPNQKVGLTILSGCGHTTVVANNGREAVEHLESGSFDVVLMDVQMPEMDGLQATAAIRKRERGTETHVPIIAMTAHAMAGDRERCLSAGMDEYVAKPVQRDDLSKAIAKVTGVAF